MTKKTFNRTLTIKNVLQNTVSFEEFLDFALAQFAYSNCVDSTDAMFNPLQFFTVSSKKQRETSKLQRVLLLFMDEMIMRLTNNRNVDILGELYQNLYPDRNGTKLTSWNKSLFLAKSVELLFFDNIKKVNIIVTPCLTGRSILAMRHSYKCTSSHFLGVNSNIILSKIAALNLYLNHIFDSEIICANSIQLDGFKEGFRVTEYGIMKIDNKNSQLLSIPRDSFYAL